MFSFEYTPGSDTENPPVLDVLVEDIDAVPGIPMPCATFTNRRDAAPSRSRTNARKWFPLSADAAHQMGRVILHAIELASLKNQRLRKWFPLSVDLRARRGKGSSNVTGDLEFVVQWRHNPALAFTPFADAVEDVPRG